MPSFSVIRKSSHSQQQAATPDNVVQQDAARAVRPPFNSNLTSERLRESSNLQALVSKMAGKIPKGRRPVFTEVGLDIDAADTARSLALQQVPRQDTKESLSTVAKEKEFGEVSELQSRKTAPVASEKRSADDNDDSTVGPRQRKRQNSAPAQPWYSKLGYSKTRPRVKSASGAPPESISGFQRVTLIAMLIAVVIPAFNLHSSSKMEAGGAHAGPIMKRETSPTDVCHRWAHQVADINGTLYIYGGEAKTEVDQETDTWNNYLLTLDMTKDWKIDSPAFKGLEVPDGPPAVANGYLWRDFDNLYLYGGQFADNPYVDPAPESIWRYSVKDKEWTEFEDPETSKGNYSTEANLPVHRSAEGAGISVPELGLSWYFGGHLDWATVPGWSTQTDRVYLKSLLEFTHPGFANTGVENIASNAAAADGGVFRNITDGGVQKEDFPERADGVLVFVPGWGKRGVLIGMAGGTADSFTYNLETLTVYDIESSEWYHQDTKGEAPSVRVNPCAVVASAPDASSFQVYFFGGQNLQPYENQKQNNDLYILSIPAFQWIKADVDSDNAPRGRAGHTCTMRDGQMIVVGGYMGEKASCDDPGVYVFDASTLKWTDSFKAGDHDDDFHPDNSVLAASYGYTVPDAVQKEIGGDEEGGATITTPVANPTGGPFATGQPPVFTVTAGGATTTIKPTSDPDSSDSGSGSDDDGPPAGTIAAGVVAGIAGALALYLGFCAWLYRRQVGAYKRHLAVANRYSGAASSDAFAPVGVFGRRGARSPDIPDETFGWVGSDRETSRWLTDPKWTPETEPSPGVSGTTEQGKRSSERGQTSGSGSGSGTAGESSENLLEGQEPSFFNVVLGPRRALRVVNGMD